MKPNARARPLNSPPCYALNPRWPGWNPFRRFGLLFGNPVNYNSFFQEKELLDTAEICGPKEVMALRGYIESVRASGVMVSRAARSALSLPRVALGISWPLDHPLLDAAVTVEDSPPPKQVPGCALETVLAIEALSTDKMIASGKRLFAPAIIFMTHVVTPR